MTCESAPTSSECASDAISQAELDLVLLDLSFRGLDVPGLIQRIKAALPGCQVYLHSDRNAIELARLGETTGADGHLAKALGREQFVSRVLKILRTRR